LSGIRLQIIKPDASAQAAKQLWQQSEGSYLLLLRYLFVSEWWVQNTTQGIIAA
jgi:hypothetical protein